MKTSRNDITGEELKTKAPTDLYRDGWDRIFGNKNGSTVESVEERSKEKPKKKKK